MPATYRLRTTMCALTIAFLTACGGGGGNNAEPSAQPSQVNNYVSIDAGNSTVPTGRYQLDTSYKGVSRLFAFDIDTLESVVAESPSLDLTMVYAPSHPEKFAIFFGANKTAITDAFVCRSNTWSAIEVQEIDATMKATVSLCPKNVSIDTVARRINFTGLMLTVANQPTKTATISADFSWSPPEESFMTPITIETGSTVVAPGSYGVNGRSAGSTGNGGLELGYSGLTTRQPKAYLYVPKSQDGRFALLVDTPTAVVDAARESYACISTGWSAADRQNVESELNSPLLDCPSSVSYESVSRLLTLNKTTLMGLNNSGRQLVISLKANFPEPRFSVEAIATNPSPSPTLQVTPIVTPVTPPAPSTGS